jgi:serine/threonine-protein phosphatase 2A regulatory subunit B''
MPCGLGGADGGGRRSGCSSRSGTRSQSWGIVAQHIQRFREQRQQQQRRSGSFNSIMTPSQRSNAQFEQVLRLAEDQPALGNTLYLCSVPPPRPDVQLFLSCPRNAEKSVDIAVIYQTFAKQVSLVKCEAELMMWDSNNDGRLSEDEVENYVKDLAPRIAALTSMSKDLLPFYCCTVSRRLFWDLDPGNRGVLRIHSLLQSSVMNEWVSLQLMSEDDPQNWFGAAVTQQLYNKFVMLDTRNKGTLNVDNLRAYKKGLPTVIDDGLPLDTSPLCTLFIDRYFETNTLMTRSEMDYRKFVDFVIAVELLPQCSRPHFFWNILDLDGTGVVTSMIVNQFFRETHAKLEAAGLDVPSRETVVQEVFDLIEKAEPLRITREEFVRSPQAGLFVGLLIDCLSFWTYENREQR